MDSVVAFGAIEFLSMAFASAATFKVSIFLPVTVPLLLGF